jgi:hypothetical protein
MTRLSSIAVSFALLGGIAAGDLLGSNAQAGDTKVVRDHRGQSNNNTAPPKNGAGAWGNDSGATVRDHRNPPPKPPCVIHGTNPPLPGC